MGFTCEVEAAYNAYYNTIALTNSNLPKPEQGGFARTNVAKRNFETSKAWIDSER